MDFTDKPERIVFEDYELLAAPKRHGRLSIRVRVIIWCACLAVALVIVLVTGGGLAGMVDKFGSGGNGGGEIQPAPPREESSRYDDISESETADDEGEKSDESDGENEVSDERNDDENDFGGEFVNVDLSFSEKGNGYLYNYSTRNPDVESLLDMGFGGGKSYYSEKPVVLILHTYIREGYFDLDPDTPTDAINKSVISVGERITYDLNCSGVPTIHCTVIHGEGKNGAYYDAAATIRYMLEIYPSIEYVIDLRRIDDRDEEGRALRTQSSLNTAQIRLTVSSNGALDKETLSLALALRRELNLGGKALCMPVVYTDAALNSGLVPYYIRVDVGSSGNLTNEALEAGKYFADALSVLLKK